MEKIKKAKDDLIFFGSSLVIVFLATSIAYWTEIFGSQFQNFYDFFKSFWVIPLLLSIPFVYLFWSTRDMQKKVATA